MTHITLIHGISNKPEPARLLEIWKSLLASAVNPVDLTAKGVEAEMVYWADVLYEKPEAMEDLESVARGLETLSVRPEMHVETPSPKSEYERVWLVAMEQKLGLVEGKPEEQTEGLERIPLPRKVKNAFLKRFLRDVHHYLFNAEFSPRSGIKYWVQDEIRQRTIAALKRGAERPGPHILITHSLGTVIGYDCLKRVSGCPQVDAFITLGSPLGIDEVQDQLKPEWSRDDGFPSAKLNGSWSNFFDKLDVVSRLDPYLASDFRQDTRQIVSDVAQNNIGLWRHDIAEYLRGEVVSGAIAALLR